MLECNISHNWYFSPDYMAIARNGLEKGIRLHSGKEKNCVVQYLNYGNYVLFSWWNQVHIGIKLGTTYVTYLKLKYLKGADGILKVLKRNIPIDRS